MTYLETSLQRLEFQITNAPPFPVQNISDPVGVHENTLARIPSIAGPGDGKLVSAEGDTRYVTSTFWTDLDDAEGDEGDEGDEIVASDEPSQAPGSTSSRAIPSQYHRNPVFRSTNAATRHLHPTENQIFSLWQTFVDNVDPILKMIHVPVTQRQLLRATQDLSQIPPTYECLMFSIYYAAVTSIQNPASVTALLQEEREALLDRYRLGVEQALHNANFMSAPDVTKLQALTIYLVCARESADKTYIWSMTGLLIRLAMKIGLHREPSTLGLPPFQAEMRRRLWWHICTLDVRTAEENDMDPLIYEPMFDTRFPANLNDADLDVHMTEPPLLTRQRSEMLYTLIRVEGSYAARKLVFSPRFTTDNGYPSLSIQEKNHSIGSILEDFSERYLRYCDNTIPICHLTVTSIQMVLAKVKLTINHPARNGALPLSDAQLCDLVPRSIEIIEYANTLRTSDQYSRWIWLFQKYIEWDAVAFLLHSLSAAPLPLPDLLERAWNAVDKFFNLWQDLVVDGDRRWRRLEHLRAKAIGKQSPETGSSDHHGHHAQTAVHGGRLEGGNAPTLTDTTSLEAPQPALMGEDQVYSDMSNGCLQQAFDSMMDAEYPAWSFENAAYALQGTSMELDKFIFDN